MSSSTTSQTSHALGEVPSRPQQPRVIVTGGSGKLGRATVSYLADAGWEVISVDSRRPPGISEDGKSGLGGAYRLVEIDLEDMGSVIETFMEVDMAYKSVQAVVHLAAIPSPGQTASAKQWRVNSVSTYNVLEAARKLNIRNIVLASSETLIGIPIDVNLPSALPITEDEPRKPQSAYSLSKLVGEVLAEQYAVWEPECKIISLRFSNVMLESEYAAFTDWQDDYRKRCWNAWGYVGECFKNRPGGQFEVDASADARDGAQAVAKALDSKLKGHHQYLVAAEDTCMRASNEELVQAVFPNVKYHATADPRGSLLSIEKARKELGYSPKYKWQDIATKA